MVAALWVERAGDQASIGLRAPTCLLVTLEVGEGSVRLAVRVEVTFFGFGFLDRTGTGSRFYDLRICKRKESFIQSSAPN